MKTIFRSYNLLILDIIMDRGRKKYYDPSKKKKRFGSQSGRIKIGNTEKKFCSHCRPTLAKRLSNKREIKDEIKKNEFYN